MQEIPAEFAGKMNFRDFKDAILVGPNGHLWHVKFFGTGVSVSFKDGWQDFVSDNHIKVKDILVVKHLRNIYFVVQVFGVIQDEWNNRLYDPKEEIL